MLKVHNLMKEYDGQPVLEGVSFHLASGERVGLVGANGSRLAGPRPSGILPRRPTGSPMKQLEEAMRRQSAGPTVRP